MRSTNAVDPQKLIAELRSRAHALGFDAFGIARTDSRPDLPGKLAHALAEGWPADMDWMEEFVVSEEEAEILSQAVSEMIEYFALMRELEVDHLEPTTHALLKRNRVRQDARKDSRQDARKDSLSGGDSADEADTLLENAPEIEDRFIAIPNVL